MSDAGPEQADRAREVLGATRQLDGCEGVLLVGNTESREAIGIALWRDEAALEAAAAKIAGDTKEAEGMGIVVDPIKFYDLVIQY